MTKTAQFLAGAILFAGAASAQVQSGRIVYEETIKMDIQLDGEAAQFAAMFPKEQTIKNELYFTEEAAIFQAVKEAAPDEDVAAEGGMRMRIQMGGGDEKIYTNIREGKTVEQREFMDRKFLVSGDVKKPSWKMTGSQKTILSYPCQEAVMIRDKDTITAWFTTGIPVSAGPHGWTGLPGMILAATSNSNISMVATSVDPGPVASGIIVQPKSGKKVSRQEFEAIMDEKMKEMGGEESGDGNVRVIIRRG